MKLTKRFLSLLLAVVMVLSMIPAVYAADEAEAPAPTRGAALGASKTYEADEWVEVDTPAELKSALANGKGVNLEANKDKVMGVRLTADITYTSENTGKTSGTLLYFGYYTDGGATVRAQTVVFDLGGHTLKADSTVKLSRLLGLYGGSTVTYTNGTIELDGTYTATAPAAFFQGACKLTVDGVNVVLKDESARATNAGMFVGSSASSTLTFINSTLTNESGTVLRGGIIDTTSGATVKLTNCILNGGNVVGGKNSSGTSYSAHGGQVYLCGEAKFEATNCQFNGGNASYGGSIYKTGSGKTVLKNCDFQDATAARGGFIYNGGTASSNLLENCTFTNGYASERAGAVMQNSRMNMKNCTFTNNESKSIGGAIMASGAYTTTYTDCKFVGNKASTGGGIAKYGSGATLKLVNVDLTGTSTSNGGALSVGSGTVILESGTIHDGTASGGNGGGNVYIARDGSSKYTYGTFIMNGGSILNGSAKQGYGGNIRIQYGRFIMNGGYVNNGTASGPCVHIYSSSIADADYSESTNDAGETVYTLEKTYKDSFYMFGGKIDGLVGGTAEKVDLINGQLLDNGSFGETIPLGAHSEITGVVDGYKVVSHIDNESTVINTAATCETAGQKTTTCETCVFTHGSTTYGGTLTAAIPALGHAWDEGVIDPEPTCNDAGVKTYTCATCGETKTEAVDATGHTEVTDAAVAPTCTTTGLTEGKHCSVCGTVTVAQEEVPALGHTEETIAGKAATCTETGLTEGKVCSVCGETTVAQTEIPAAGHTEVIDDAVAPTCTATGMTEGKHCSVCGTVIVAQEEVPALGHAWDEGVIDPKPTCNDAGVKTYTCATCGETKTEAVDATGHTEVTDDAVAPTCTATGLTEGKHCSVCGTVTVAQQEVPSLGHSYTEVKTEATFESDAFTTYTCSVCGDSYTETEEGTKLTAVATADGVPFQTLQEALTAGGTVVLLQDVADSDALEVKNTVVLDLNGKTVSKNDASGKAAQLIKNSGDLTIVDSVGNGKLTFHSTTPSASNSYSTSTIINVGELKILSGTIENTTASGPSYAIDNAWYTTDVSLSVEGGTVTAVKPAIRQVPFSTTAKNTITISGGELSGYAGLQIHNYQKSACLSDVTITGGTFNGSYAFYTSYSYNNTATGTNIAIDGGAFNGYVYLYNGNTGSAEYPMNVSVTGGTFNTGYYCYGTDSTGAMVAIPSVTGGTHIYDVTDYCVEGYGMHANGDGTYGIHQHAYTGEYTEATFEADAFTTYTCGTCGDSYTVTEEGTQLRVPTADVGKLEAQTLKAGEYGIYNGSLVESTEDLPLEVVVKLSATETEAGSMADWLVDFNLTFTGMANGSITADKCYLAGNYGEFGWIAIPTDGMVLEDGVTYPVVAVAGIHLNYNDIVTSVKEFIAAIHIDQAILDANPNLAVNLELVMTDPEDADNKIQVGEDMIYTAEDLKNEELILPEAEVTPMGKVTLTEDEYRVWNGMVREPGITEDKALVAGKGEMPLEVVVNFKAIDTLEECLAGGYSKWLVDFNITVDGLANGSFVANDCYLAGNYGSYGWIKIPLDGQTISEGAAYPVVALYDPTLNYKDICKSVKDFTAAIHIDQAILDANPDLTVKLELVMTNPNTGNTLQIGEDLIYGFEALRNGTVAMNKETGAVYTTVEAAIEEAVAGQTIVLLVDYEEKDLWVLGGITLDLNGHTLKADHVAAAFEGANIIDSTDGKGLLVVARNQVGVYSNNAQLPVWLEEEGGYRFVEVELKQKATIKEDGNGFFRFYIAGEDAQCALQQALSDGGADNGVYVKVELNWTDTEGRPGGQKYFYSDALLEEYATNWLGKEFQLTILGMDKITELNLTASLVYKNAAGEEKVVISGATQTLGGVQ